MSDVVIRVENLGKQYRLGQRKRSNSLRESLVSTLKHPLRRLSARGNGPAAVPDTFWALKDVSFEVKQGEVVGIIGRNGAGKSTLLKILSRITEPTVGEIELTGRVGSLLEVGTGFHPELTGRENVFLNGAILGMRREEITRKFDEIVAFAEVEKFIDTPVKHYSSGMYMRLAFSVAAHLEPEILVVDEVLAVGDADFQKKCLGKMGEVAREGRTVLFVSHNMAAIEQLCTTALLLDCGRIRQRGELSRVVAHYLDASRLDWVQFERGPLTDLGVRQVADSIEIELGYRATKPLRMVCFGFVISDHLGQPICGINPKTGGLSDFGHGTREGRVKVVVNQPKLLNGNYRLSIWFGDGTEDFVVVKDCVCFEVSQMVKHHQYSTSVVGCVSPNCSWHLETA
jgi:lipopolysaccharide transport system ATP-binding protein